MNDSSDVQNEALQIITSSAGGTQMELAKLVHDLARILESREQEINALKLRLDSANIP